MVRSLVRTIDYIHYQGIGKWHRFEQLVVTYSLALIVIRHREAIR